MSVENNRVFYNPSEGVIMDLSKIWVLLDCSTNNKMKNYEIVHATDVADINGRFNAGKMVQFVKEGVPLTGIIVAISDSPTFLRHELSTLTNKQYDQQAPKKYRKRSIGAKINGATALPPTSATASGSPLMPATAAGSAIASTSGSGTGSGPMSGRASTDLALASQLLRLSASPSPPLSTLPLTSASNAQIARRGANQSVIKTNPNAKSTHVMTFDQQTQTDESLLDGVRVEKKVDFLSDVMHDVGGKMGNLNECVLKIGSTMEAFMDYISRLNNTSPEPFLSTLRKATESIEMQQTNPPRILNGSHQLNSSSQTLDYNIMTIEPAVDETISTDSNFSLSNNSRISLNASNQSIYQESNANDSIQYAVATPKRKTPTGSRHADEDGDPSELMALGFNNTMIKRSIIQNINWNTYTGATRRLLRACFSREVLASHSLTGKPSPGKCR